LAGSGNASSAIRYGLVARISRSQTVCVSSTIQTIRSEEAGVQFPVSENFLLAFTCLSHIPIFLFVRAGITMLTWEICAKLFWFAMRVRGCK
jgi:hypothetical protein